MKRIAENSVRGWSSLGGKKFPSAIFLLCPHCFQLGVFTLKDHLHDPKREAMSASGRCPACQHHVGFWGVNEGGQECADIFFHPDNNDYKEILKETSDLPDTLVRSYQSSVDAFNSGNYPATAVCCRRTLEGIFKYLLPTEERDQSLAKLIEKSLEHKDLAILIKELAGVIRKGGNLGAHFDMETEPDEVVARSMVDLLEYLIFYLYTVPQKITELEKKLENDA